MTLANSPVPSDLYWRLEGDGPFLLIAQSGDGDADRTMDLVAALASNFTTIVYDRRGLSRSPSSAPSISPQQHAADMHALIATITAEPVAILGLSLGALYGLHLAAAHPNQVRCVIAHDPAAPRLLPNDKRRDILAILDEVEEAYRSEGVRSAMARIAAATGIRPDQEMEAGVTLAPFSEHRLANLKSFLSRDIPGLRRSTLGEADIRKALDAGVCIIPAAGKNSRAAWNYGCAEVLSQIVGVPIAEFPGGHNGNTTHPRAFGRALRELLQSVSQNPPPSALQNQRKKKELCIPQSGLGLAPVET